MGELKKWLKQDWVRIGTDGSIKGKCGTSKDKKNPGVRDPGKPNPWPKAQGKGGEAHSREGGALKV